MDTTDKTASLPRRAMTVQEFCNCYAISRTKAYEIFAEGKLKTVKLGARTLVPTEDAELWFRGLDRSSLQSRKSRKGRERAIALNKKGRKDG